jgi:hypothetical protein
MTDIILEHLRALRGDTASMREDIQFLKDGLLAVRNEVHELRGDLLRFEQRAEKRLDRIEKRLELTEA